MARHQHWNITAGRNAVCPAPCAQSAGAWGISRPGSSRRVFRQEL